jgi:serine phosphatase RsbU (regulator of sigma subunit)
VTARSDPQPVTGLKRRLDPSLQLVLIEDDDGDAFLVAEYLAEVDPELHLVRARSIAEARLVLSSETGCVLLDLALPDAFGFSGLDAVLEAAPGAAVIVLTGLTDEERGLEAAARGAQDYLNKGQVEPQLLARAIRYALERKRAEETARRLAASELRAAENTRLERGLLPRPLLHGDAIAVTARYRPGRRRALLGGDFYDVVECTDGVLFAMIGDVCGHGPDEAALGVCLRIAWRALVLAGTPVDRIFPLLGEVLCHERSGDEIFATACMMRLDEEHASADIYLAGHPAPIVLGAPALADATGAPLGVDEREVWKPLSIRLQPSWSMLLFTDGMIEGGTGQGTDRLGVERLRGLLDQARAAAPNPEEWADILIDAVEELNEGALADDLAMLVLTHRGRT